MVNILDKIAFSFLKTSIRDFHDKILENVIEQGVGVALAQIKAKGYHEKYEALGRDIYLVGIEFDRGERNVRSFEWELLVTS